MEEILCRLRADRDAFFYRTQGGAELDLLLMRDGKRIGFEFKFQDAPRASKAMHVALEDLGLDRLYVVYPGTQAYPLDERMEVVPLRAVDEALLTK
jgi:hypothetical protein